MTGPHGRALEARLDERKVAEIVSQQFPEFDNCSVARLGGGWDNEMFVLNGRVVFRFPKRENGDAWLGRELQVAGAAEKALGGIVPHFAYIGRPSPAFACRFAGYPLLAGVPAGSPGVPLGMLAADVARALGALHALDGAALPATPDNWESEPADLRRTELMALAAEVRSHLRGELLAQAEPYLEGHVPAPQGGVRRLAHNDICARHLLVDATSGRLTGMIDWGDAMATDPVVDFAGLITVSGWAFVREVVAAYPQDLGSNFVERLVWTTRTCALQWLGEAARSSRDEIPQCLGWVARAFAPYEG